MEKLIDEMQKYVNKHPISIDWDNRERLSDEQIKKILCGKIQEEQV